MFKEHFEELKHTGELPSPSGVGMRILVETQRDDCSLDDIVTVIQADPALTGRILKLASSGQFGGKAAITTVKEAAIRLGLRTVSNVALGFTLVAGNRSGRCPAFDYDRYWSWSLANAVAANAVSRELKVGDPAESFTCALLARIGELALASVHPSEYATVLEASRQPGGASLTALERDRFQIDHYEVASAMLADWGLPECFGTAALALGNEEDQSSVTDPRALEFLKVLTIAQVFTEMCLEDEADRHKHWAKLERIRSEEELSEERLETIYDEICAGWEDWGRMLRVLTGPVTPAAVLRERSRKDLAEQPDTRSPGTAGGLRILAVDDDPVSLRLLQRHLESAGHEVVTATNGKAALAAALDHNPQIVVTDWMMPEMDGLQFCKALRRFSSGRNMYVLLLTGRGEEDRVVEAFEAGVDDYIVKPFKPKLLLARIRAGRRVVELQQLVEKDKKLQREQVAKLAVLNRKLRAAALTDPLTELPNRRYAMKRLEIEWANALRSDQPMSVLMVDIDHFKRINDTHGHDIGDLVLRETAKALGRKLRRSDTCARIGGEEFLVISPNTDREGARILAERIREEVESTVIREGNYNGSVTVSLGVATKTSDLHLDNVELLLKMADSAAYEAKKLGRNRWVESDGPSESRKSA
ncbi:MAG: diguanylate cyclase [Planctomycetota bacterium]